LAVPVTNTAKVVDHLIRIKPSGTGWFSPTDLGTPAQGGAFDLSRLRIWNASTGKWSSSATTPDGTWAILDGKARFIARPGFLGTTSLRYQVRDTKGNLVDAKLTVIIEDDSALPRTGIPISDFALNSLIMLMFGLAIINRRRLFLL
jgi:hypothetical protein